MKIYVMKWAQDRKKLWQKWEERMGGELLTKICKDEKSIDRRPPGRSPKKRCQS